MSRRKIVVGIGLALVSWVMLDALGAFDSQAFTAIPHGSHDHYVPKIRDEGVGADNCPTRAPESDEFISMQCQMIRQVESQGTVYFVPDNVQAGIPYTALPTRAPGSGEIITPGGELVQATELQTID